MGRGRGRGGIRLSELGSSSRLLRRTFLFLSLAVGFGQVVAEVLLFLVEDMGGVRGDVAECRCLAAPLCWHARKWTRDGCRLGGGGGSGEVGEAWCDAARHVGSCTCSSVDASKGGMHFVGRESGVVLLFLLRWWWWWWW